jgi:hypothetical protein
MATPPVFVAGQVLTAAQMNAIGMWEVKTETAFTSATTVTIDNIFTSDFRNYLIKIVGNATSGSGVSSQLRVGGVAAATNYNVQSAEMINTTAWTVATSTAQTSFGTGSFAAAQGAIDLQIYAPAVAGQTNFLSTVSYAGATATVPGYQLRSGNHSTATAYDGIAINFTVAATGTYTVYGYTK